MTQISANSVHVQRARRVRSDEPYDDLASLGEETAEVDEDGTQVFLLVEDAKYLEEIIRLDYGLQHQLIER